MATANAGLTGLWDLSAIAADAPALAPWRPIVSGADRVEDALAELHPRAHAVAPFDVVELRPARPGTTTARSYWFVRDDGRARPLPGVQFTLGAAFETEALRPEWSDYGRDWRRAWVDGRRMDGAPRWPGGPSAADMARLAVAAGLPGRSVASVLVGTLSRLGADFTRGAQGALAEGLARLATVGEPGGLEAWAAWARSRAMGPVTVQEAPPVRFLRGLVLVGAAAGGEGHLAPAGLSDCLYAWGDRLADERAQPESPFIEHRRLLSEAVSAAYAASREEVRAALPLAAVLLALTEGAP